jgi:hypothetical protein
VIWSTRRRPPRSQGPRRAIRRAASASFATPKGRSHGRDSSRGGGACSGRATTRAPGRCFITRKRYTPIRRLLPYCYHGCPTTRRKPRDQGAFCDGRYWARNRTLGLAQVLSPMFAALRCPQIRSSWYLKWYPRSLRARRPRPLPCLRDRLAHRPRAPTVSQLERRSRLRAA